MLNIELLIGGLTVFLTLIGMIFKSISEMKLEIQSDAIFRAKTDERLKLLDFRLRLIEKNLSNLVKHFDSHFEGNEEE